MTLGGIISDPPNKWRQV